MELTIRRGCVIPCELHVVGHKQYCFWNAFLFELVDTKIFILLDTRAFLLTGTSGTEANTVDWFSAREREGDCNGGGKAGRHTDCRVAYYHTPNKVVYYHTLCVSHITTHQPNPLRVAHLIQKTVHCNLFTAHITAHPTGNGSYCTKYTSYNTHRVIFTSNSNTACCRLQPAH